MSYVTKSSPRGDDPFYSCACGRKFANRVEWETALSGKTYVNNEGSLVEQRTCRTCESTMTKVLLLALSVSELRNALRVINMMNETFNQQFTAPELLLLVRACWESKWDITPDCWTPQQWARALSDGLVPDFEDNGDHAVGVTDCPCRRCKR